MPRGSHGVGRRGAAGLGRGAVTLRPHQLETLERMRASQARRICVVAPTGYGKTVLFAEICRSHRRHGGTPLVIVHRRELVRQAEARLGGVARVTSIQALTASGERPEASMLVWDEAHHAPAGTWRAVADAYGSAIHLGFTATPMRADGQPMGDMFDELIVGSTVRELTAAGWLTPSVVLAPETETAALWHEPYDAWQRYTPGQPAVVFAASVAHAKAVAAAWGPRGAHVDGGMSKINRDGVLARFADGSLDMIANAMLLTEGWDCPRAAVCILARGCSHPGAWLQMVGRVLRPWEGKAAATVIDLRGMVHSLGLPDEDRVWSLTGTACRRTETLTAMMRCGECLALYRPARVCPRCGSARGVAAELPRVLNRAETLLRVSGWPEERRRAAYRARMQSIGETRRRMQPAAAARWAEEMTARRFAS